MLKMKFKKIEGNFNIADSSDDFYVCTDTKTNRTVAKIYASEYNIHTVEIFLFTKNNEEVTVFAAIDGELDDARHFVAKIIQNDGMRLYNERRNILREEL